VDWQIREGSHGLVPVGTTGESPTLSHEEHRRVIEIAVDVAERRVPVVAGAGSNSTDEAISLTRFAEDIGADYVLSVVPYYNKPTQEGLYQHYRAIADSTSLPIVVYNVPGRTGVNVEVATLVRLAAIPNIIGVKEASGSMQQMCEICRAVPPGFLVLSGDDAMALPLMAVGGHGVISVVSNEMPAEVARMIEAAERNDFTAARAIHNRIMPLIMANFIEANPVPVKAAMAAMGLIEETYRLPMVGPKAESREKIVNVLKDLGLAKGAYV